MCSLLASKGKLTEIKRSSDVAIDADGTAVVENDALPPKGKNGLVRRVNRLTSNIPDGKGMMINQLGAMSTARTTNASQSTSYKDSKAEVIVKDDNANTTKQLGKALLQAGVRISLMCIQWDQSS